MLKGYINFLKKHPLITAAIAIVYAMVCIKCIKVDTYFQMFLIRSLLCGAMAFFLYQISGEKTLTSSYNSTWYVIKVAMGFWIFALPLGVVSFFSNAEAPMWDNIPFQFISLFLMFIFVGLFEEMAFRALINDAIIYKFRNYKYVFILSAVCCSLSFGIAHIVGADISTSYALVQALGKIVSSGVFGLALLVLYWKTRNIWACGLVHGIYDFLLSIYMGVFNVDNTHTSYVMSEEFTIPLLIVYSISTLISLLILYFIWRKIGKKIDWDEMRENW